MGETTVGPDALVERFLQEYGLAADSWPSDMVENDTDRLLLALLLEQRGETGIAEAVDAATTTGSGSENETGDYWSSEGQIRPGNEWEHIEFDGMVATSIDLRMVDAGVTVRFAEPGAASAEVTYRKKDSPVVGIPVETTQMWIKKPENQLKQPGVIVQAWGDA